jgi:hypothetical protein
MKLFNPAMLVFLPLMLLDFNDLQTAVKGSYKLDFAENWIIIKS